MHVKTLASLIALGTALAFAGPAAAQSINGSAISAADLPKVQARCDELATAKGSQSLSTDTEQSDSNDSSGAIGAAGVGTDNGSDDGAGTSSDSTEGSDATANAPAVNGTDALTVGSLNIETITLEACQAGGLVK